MENEYIASLRKEYTLSSLELQDFPDDPVLAFRHWFDFAVAEQVSEANAMVLATSDSVGQPHARVVLMKDITRDGIVFFTNYNSHKGQELAENPKAALVFFWAQQERQIRIEGTVHKTDDAVNDEYFLSRPVLSQAGAIVSNQSSRIESRRELEEAMEKVMQNAASGPLERPKNWGGYCLKPAHFEFWQGRAGRVHDRIAFDQTESGWEKYRMSP
ncbi:MAG: pyridoxamine 5'-phosphate oxidase [Bacteroidetes bacterium]|nr:pyridoxamine 5'-phosphate oxidase [Bacteroidota bacterium]